MQTFEQKPSVAKNDLNQQSNTVENNLNDQPAEKLSNKQYAGNSIFSDVKHNFNNFSIYPSGQDINKQTAGDDAVKKDDEEKQLQRKENGAGNNSVAPAIVHEVLNASGRQLDSSAITFFNQKFHHDFSSVRIHTDARAAASANAVNALAYTVGNNIVFGSNQFNVNSAEGKHLLAHELSHTIQQQNAKLPSSGKLGISSPGDYHEQQAERMAHSVSQGIGANDGDGTEDPEKVLAASPMKVALLQRVISFTTAPGTFTPNNVVANEDAAGFVLTSPPGTFQWQPDVTIHGDAADNFADWEVAHHQVGKGFWMNVWWGTGADRTHRRRTINGGLPMRDATAAGNTWYSDWRAQQFTANGDVRSPVMRDTPSTGRIPWANPVAGRGGTRGWFNYGFGFVSTLSARHIPDGTGAAAFRHLNHVHWNFGVDGTFDTAAPTPGRVRLNGGNINRSGVIPGVDNSNRPMHGGDIINNNFNTVDT